VRALDELGQPRVGLNQIIAVPFGCGEVKRMRSKPSISWTASSSWTKGEGWSSRFSVSGGDESHDKLKLNSNLVAVAGDDLAEQRDFLYTL